MAQAVTEATIPRLAINSSLDHNLRLLFAQLGTPHCLKCGSAIEPQTTWEIAARLATLPPGTPFELVSPATKSRKAASAIAALQAPEVDEQEEFMPYLIGLVSLALRMGRGVILVRIGDKEEPDRLMRASDRKICVVCGTTFPNLILSVFNPRSRVGMCLDCHGSGKKGQTDGAIEGYVSFTRQQPCLSCAGTGINAKARSVTLLGKSIVEVRRMSPYAMLAWANDLEASLSEESLEIAVEALKEVRARLRFLCSHGPHKVRFDYQARALCTMPARSIAQEGVA